MVLTSFLRVDASAIAGSPSAGRLQLFWMMIAWQLSAELDLTPITLL
jgi:hypothetical protein